MGVMAVQSVASADFGLEGLPRPLLSLAREAIGLRSRLESE